MASLVLTFGAGVPGVFPGTPRAHPCGLRARRPCRARPGEDTRHTSAKVSPAASPCAHALVSMWCRAALSAPVSQPASCVNRRQPARLAARSVWPECMGRAVRGMDAAPGAPMDGFTASRPMHSGRTRLRDELHGARDHADALLLHAARSRSPRLADRAPDAARGAQGPRRELQRRRLLLARAHRAREGREALRSLRSRIRRALQGHRAGVRRPRRRVARRLAAASSSSATSPRKRRRRSRRSAAGRS